MRIQEHEVTDIKKDSAMVGCTRVTREDLEKLLKEMYNAPDQEFPIGNNDDIIGLCKDNFCYAFMEIRESGEFAGKGFFLDDKDTWVIVQDDEGSYVLVRVKDTEGVEWEDE